MRNVPLPDFKPGQKLLASDLQLLRDALIQVLTGGPGVQITSFGDRLVVSVDQKRTPNSRFRQMSVVSNHGDYIKCKALNASGSEDGDSIYVLKPWELRRSPFDGETVGGVAYEYSSDDERTATPSSGAPEVQSISPEYFAGAVIYAMDTDTSVEVETDQFSKLIDVNLDGRKWKAETIRQAKIKSTGDDHLVCRLLDAGGSEGDTDLYVMKPWLLRKSPFDGQTVNGVSYTYSDAHTREATPSGGDPETQKITQDYYTNAVIMVGKMDVVLSVGGQQTNLIDLNDSGRAWAVPSEET